MTTFKTDISDYKPVLFRSAITILGIWIVYGVIYFIVQGHMVTGNYYWVASVTLIVNVFDIINKDRLYELSVDYESRQIYFFYKRIFSKSKKITLSFADARLEIVERKPFFKKAPKSIKLYFLKKKKECFEIDRSKDGFSKETLQEICKTVENIPLQVLRV